MKTHQTQSRYKLGLPVVGIIGLALFAAPRVVLHDLHIIEEGSAINALLVWSPPIIWIIVVVAKRVPTPFLTLLAVGVVYGVVLATGHLIFWEQAFPEGAPQLGGNLAELDPTAQALIIKTFSTISSGVTGTLVGVVCGTVALIISKLLYRTPDSKTTNR